MPYNYPQMPTGSIAQEPLVNPPAGAQMPGAQAGFQQPQYQNQFQNQGQMGNQQQNQYGGFQGNAQTNPPNLESLFQSYLGQAQPQPFQPQGFQQAAGQSQMDLLSALQPGQGGAFGPIEQEEMKRFREEILPGIRQQFSSQGRSSAQDQMELRGAQDLSQRLSAQRTGREENRLGQLQQFLSGQQQLGQQERGQNLQGALGFGQLNRGFQQDQISQILDILKSGAQLGSGQGDTIRQEGMMKPLMQALSQIAASYAGSGGTT